MAVVMITQERAARTSLSSVKKGAMCTAVACAAVRAAPCVQSGIRGSGAGAGGRSGPTAWPGPSWPLCGPLGGGAAVGPRARTRGDAEALCTRRRGLYG